MKEDEEERKSLYCTKGPIFLRKMQDTVDDRDDQEDQEEKYMRGVNKFSKLYSCILQL